MKKMTIALALAGALIAAVPAFAQGLPNITGNEFQTAQPGKTVVGTVPMCIDASTNKAAPCPGGGGGTGGAPNAAATSANGFGSGATGSVSGIISGAASKTAYLCSFDVSAIGGTSPITVTVTGLLGGTRTFQMSSSEVGSFLVRTYNPCLPASAQNSPIVVITTGAAGATTVNVNAEGFRQ